MNYLFPLLFGFLIGSVPTTFLLVKWRKRLDIRKEGTGNVGAMNTYEVTGSAWLGVAELAFDGLKGAASVLLAERVWGAVVYYIGVVELAPGFGYVLMTEPDDGETPAVDQDFYKVMDTLQVVPAGMTPAPTDQH